LSKEPTILLRSVQVMAGGATFRGFRRCTECSFTDLIPPDHVPYDQQLPCPEPGHRCVGKMIPLLDSEVVYYLQRHKDILLTANKLRVLLSF
jgi:hypothetical protein